MLRELDKLHAAGFIETDELAMSRDAQKSGPWKHTIGYEVEVFPSAAADVPNGVTLHGQTNSMNGSDVSPYGYVVGDDAYYELSSPHAQHPLPLTIATRGLMRAGYLPCDSDGWVGSHVSIGTVLPLDDRRADMLTRALRITEMIGGTTAMRLSAPLRQASDRGESVIDHRSWAVRGEFGLSVVNWMCMFSGRRIGSETTVKNRAEFRSLAYQNPVQFGKTLEAIYFLTRAALARPKTPQREAWDELQDWLLNDSGLPDHLSVTDHTSLAEVYPYLEPYIEKIRDDDTGDVTHLATQAIDRIRVSVGLDHIPSAFAEAA